MRFSIAEPSRLTLALLLTSASVTTAFPWSSDYHGSKHIDSHINDDSPRFGGIFPQLTWLRDATIEAIFGPPTPEINPPTYAQRSSSKSKTPASLRVRYAKDVVLRFNMSTPEEVVALEEAADTLFLDVWAFTTTWADIRIAECDLPSLLGLLPKSLQTSYAPLMPNLSDAIYDTYPSRKEPTLKTKHAFTDLTAQAGDSNNMFFQDYQPLSVIVPWMKLMASMFTSHVTYVNIGLSFEGREIPALRIGVRPPPSSSLTEPPVGRKTIIINGGSHAREWISTASVTYIAWHLISEYGKNGQITKLLHEFDWVFIPTLNPDGYVYTWDTDRLWRKNRQETSLRFCKGIDLDRSFGFKWDGTAFQSNPCSESYPGDEAFQAVEAKALADWSQNEETNGNVTFIGFLDLHSYSQQVLYPYSYTCDAEPPTLENLEELGIGIAKAIRISQGEEYTVQSACEGNVELASARSSSHSTKSEPKFRTRVESGGGSALDWFYSSMRAKYSYQIKLRDTGAYGFLLPREMIVPVGEECVDAVKYFGGWVLGNKGIESQGVPEGGDVVASIVKGDVNEEQTEQAEETAETAKAEEEEWVEVDAEEEEGNDDQVVMRDRLGESWELRRRK